MSILSDAELVALGRIKLGVDKTEKMIAHLNALSVATGLPLRHVSSAELALLHNDISKIARGHELAEDEIKKSALALLEKSINGGVGNFDKQADHRVGSENRVGNRRNG